MNTFDMQEYLRECYPTLTIKRAEIDGVDGVKRWVIVCTPLYVSTNEAGPIQPARITACLGSIYLW